MTVELRMATPADAASCGRICYEAFKSLADRHGFPPDFPSSEVASGLLSLLIGHDGVYSIVASADGTPVGSNFMDERSPIFGIGPISVDPATQKTGVGRAMMEHMLVRASEQGASGVRLVQAGYNNQSLCLYTRLGFRTREPLSLLTGSAPQVTLAGHDVRHACVRDAEACNALCRRLHGYERGRELADAITAGTATVVERHRRITGYATAIGFLAHAVAETDADLMALIGAATEITGPGILVPTRNHELFSWCLENRLELVFQMNLMSLGLYNDPAGAYLPSILY